MTLTEIMKACEVENETLKGEAHWPVSSSFLFNRIQVTNDLIKQLALHVKQLKLNVEVLEDKDADRD